MKKVLLSLGILAGSTAAMAQLPVGAIAPDFTLTDINGTSHHLYNYLDQGYTVIIDISAAWCGPCWSAHESGFMKNLYDQYGPTGTVEAGKVMVIYVEGESTNTTDQLMGIGSNPPTSYADGTQGDWVTGEPYPFIDNSSLNSQYQIGGFPTFTVVCPNRQVMYAEAGFGSAMGAVSYWTPFVDDCPTAVDGTNGGIIQSTTDQFVCAGGSTPLKATIQNIGTAPLTSATVNAKLNGATIATTNWTGNLGTYAFEEVNIGNYTFSGATNDVTYEIVATGDAVVTDNTLSRTASSLSSNYKDWVVELKTDQYPTEIGWKILSSSGTQVAGKNDYTGDEGGADAGQVFTYPVQLNASECYTIEVTDDYGDGLYGVQAAADTGYFRVRDDAGNVYNFGGGYESGYSIIAKTGSTPSGIDNIFANADNITVYPNPTSGLINVDFQLKKNSQVSLNVVNMVGQVVLTETEAYNVGYNKATLNTQSLASGIYILNIVTEEGTIQKKFTKK